MITTRERDVPIGLIEVRFESTFAASVGFVLQRSEWNRGYMTGACSDLVDRLFTLPRIWRVWAYCDIENRASARVLERSGMQHEGILRRAMLHPNRSDGQAIGVLPELYVIGGATLLGVDTSTIERNRPRSYAVIPTG